MGSRLAKVLGDRTWWLLTNHTQYTLTPPLEPFEWDGVTLRIYRAEDGWTVVERVAQEAGR